MDDERDLSDQFTDYILKKVWNHPFVKLEDKFGHFRTEERLRIIHGWSKTKYLLHCKELHLLTLRNNNMNNK